MRESKVQVAPEQEKSALPQPQPEQKAKPVAGGNRIDPEIGYVEKEPTQLQQQYRNFRKQISENEKHNICQNDDFTERDANNLAKKGEK